MPNIINHLKHCQLQISLICLPFAYTGSTHMVAMDLIVINSLYFIAKLEIITPSDPEQRGCQLSLKFFCSAEEINQKLYQKGVIVSLIFI